MELTVTDILEKREKEKLENRRRALDAAIRITRSDSKDEVVETAKHFYQFLEGETKTT